MIGEMTDVIRECKSAKRRTHDMHGTKLVECVDKSDCRWSMDYRYISFCKNPSIIMIANSKNASVAQKKCN